MVVGLLGNKILVFGSSGLLGTTFTKKFKNKLNLVTFSLKSNSNYNVDISNIKELSLLTDKLDIRYIVNFSALVDIDFCENNKELAYKVNCEGVKNLSLICNKKKCKLIHISTDHVYNSEGYNSENNVKFINYYGKSKYLGEIEALKCNSIILRTNFFGKSNGIKKSFSDVIMNNAKMKKRIYLFNDVFFNPLRMETLLSIIHKLILENNDNKGIFNLGSNYGFSKGEFIKKMLKFKKINCELIDSSVKNFFDNRSNYMLMDVKKFEKDFNMKLPKLDKEIIDEFC